MALDRDLAVAVLSAWAKGHGARLSGWEMLAATGARGLRLLNESGAFAEILHTEANPDAFEILARNASTFAGARPERADALQPRSDGPFDYVDLDPYGTPAPFVAAAMDATAPGGLLAVTATDMPVLAGVQRSACEARYGGRPVRGHFGPEGGLRILIAFLVREAAARGREARPVLAYVHDHHVRVYLALDAGGAPSPVGELPSPDYRGPDLGAGPYGPMWIGPLFDHDLLPTIAVPPGAAEPRELGTLLERFREESRADVPFYYEPNGLAHAAHVDRPPALATLLEALRTRGFASGRSHMRPSAFRTLASEEEVLRIVRELATRAGPSPAQ